EVVPFGLALARRAAAPLLAAAALAAALALPLPEGVLSPRHRLAPAENPISRDALDDLLRRAEELQARANLVRTPAMQRVVEDLAQLQAGLRTRSLARDEA